ncbi:molybdopterin molybdenumtransferase MoeA [Glutamicibacter soli]|uniref:Molybdopterin molybdenumtransferase n=1 Tax=Glutamicibacter soli TaxID=453836 RepID=A0A6L9G298_9MICC|nr:gephyrin-like molybdotransferase Glp [Glutamicibacter soli]NAZ15861.1 molybdopterin molybdenumtransferase MoeA [Glutamicibacter soli]
MAPDSRSGAGPGAAPVPPEEHLRAVLQLVRPLPPVQLSLAEPGDFAALHGAVLAQDVDAAHPLPLWENSAMDGYAVRAADTAQAPVDLQVLGVVPAGSGADPVLGPGQTVRIMTGAPLPSSADAVVRVEDTSGFHPGTVRINTAVQPGRDVRRAGEDRAAGAPVALAGEPLTAARLSALAAAGAAALLVRPAPKIAVLVTGAELRTPGSALSRGQIPESNSLLLAGLLAESGLPAATVEHCPDDPGLVRQRLDALGAQHDAVISTGGVGPGEYDVMRQVLEQEPEVRAVRLALRPGAPQCVGRLRAGALVFALPGNPVSAAVGFELFVRPALRALQGHASPRRPVLRSTVLRGWKSPPGRLQALPVVFDEHGGCAPAVDAASISHSVGGFGAAQGYALIGPDTSQVRPGDTVDVLRLQP